MKIHFYPDEINLKPTKNDLGESLGTFEYKVNSVKVEGFKTPADAIKHAEFTFIEFIKMKYFKGV